jgi:hypothetical protein
VTPKSIRLRKKLLLEHERKRAGAGSLIPDFARVILLLQLKNPVLYFVVACHDAVIKAVLPHTNPTKGITIRKKFTTGG